MGTAPEAARHDDAPGWPRGAWGMAAEGGARHTNGKRKRTEKHTKPSAEIGNDMPAPSTHKVALCIFGTIARSIQHTWKHMETKLIGPLALVGFEVDIYGFDMELGSSDRLDGVAVN